MGFQVFKMLLRKDKNKIVIERKFNDFGFIEINQVLLLITYNL